MSRSCLVNDSLTTVAWCWVSWSWWLIFCENIKNRKDPWTILCIFFWVLTGLHFCFVDTFHLFDFELLIYCIKALHHHLPISLKKLDVELEEHVLVLESLLLEYFMIETVTECIFCVSLLVVFSNLCWHSYLQRKNMHDMNC